MGVLKPPQLDEIDAEVVRLIGSAVAAAKEAPLPNAADLTTDVYGSYYGTNTETETRRWPGSRFAKR
jgi:TPP-dependent pyruvate/acetoin dehydrogenase alpha subunit